MTPRALLDTLARPFTADDRLAFGGEVAALEQRLEHVAATAPSVDPAVLLAARLGGSTTLGRPGASLTAWLAANEVAASVAQKEAPFTVEVLRRINARLRELGPSDAAVAPLRDTDAFMGSRRCPSPGDLEALLAPMTEAVVARASDVHPIAGAALLQQWILSVHPFGDANGRTARLAADGLLAQYGYPPATYASPARATNAVVDHGRAPISVLASARIVLRGVANTVELLATGTFPCQPSASAPEG